jgi:hypothetical protein
MKNPKCEARISDCGVGNYLLEIGSKIQDLAITCVLAVSDYTGASFSAAISREHQQVRQPFGSQPVVSR